MLNPLRSAHISEIQQLRKADLGCFGPLELPNRGRLAHLWATRCSCRCHGRPLLRRRLRLEQIAQADQVVGDHVQAAPLFAPAKHLLDAAAGIDRLGVALVARGTPIDGRASKAGRVLRHVRRETDAADHSDKAPS